MYYVLAFINVLIVRSSKIHGYIHIYTFWPLEQSSSWPQTNYCRDFTSEWVFYEPAIVLGNSLKRYLLAGWWYLYHHYCSLLPQASNGPLAFSFFFALFFFQKSYYCNMKTYSTKRKYMDLERNEMLIWTI